ncbi:glycosyltransferase [bacterium]|nr:glycosyltransferase [bacterium]
MNGKVSCITPCFNGASYLHNYINGMLSQTYKNVELIFVNDGSTDNTEDIILSYEDKFKEKGWDFIYIKKENGGQASAINKGLKIFTGDYLCWIDSDDIILPTFFEEMSSFLKNNAEYDFVSAEVEHVLENTLKVIYVQRRDYSRSDKDIFWDNVSHLDSVNVHSTFLMVKSKAFLKINPNRSILEDVKTQIPQLALPLFYFCKCGYIKKVLAKYVVRADSDSHSCEVSRLERLSRYERENLHALENMNMPQKDKERAISLSKNYFEKMKLEVVYSHYKSVKGKDVLKVLNNNGILTYFCDIDNFGDALNKYIFSDFLGKGKIQSSSIYTSNLIGIGSLLDNVLLDNKSKFINRKYPLRVFSSGFGFDVGGFFHNPDIIFPERLKRDVVLYALRGKLTKKRLEDILGKKIEVALGDGGLLASCLLENEKIEKKYDLGIVPHYADYNNEIFKSIQKNIPNSKILDITSNPIDFLRELASCRAVISTAMHPLIACDSLRIPNLWVRISEKTTSRYKFYDYYSVFNKKKEPFDLLKNKFTKKNLADIVNNYDITDDEVLKIQNDLKKALLKLKSDLDGDISKVKTLCRKVLIKNSLIKFLCAFIFFKSLRQKIRNKYLFKF